MNKKNSRYDLEDRTRQFALEVRSFVKKLPRSISNQEDIRQVVRSSGSVASNYIEANEALSKKDFKHRIKICRKEAKESQLWLRLLDSQRELEAEQEKLFQEALELTKIFGAIVEKTR